jgi:hypothetical protein
MYINQSRKTYGRRETLITRNSEQAFEVAITQNLYFHFVETFVNHGRSSIHMMIRDEVT